MNVSESFSKVIGVALLFVALVAAFLFLWQVLPPNHVHAQNAGNVGIQPTFQPVFKSQSTTASSAVFQDVGQGESVLFFCTTSFAGTIDIEWTPTPIGSSAYLVLTSAFYPAIGLNDTGCHKLEVGGYYPNMRSTVTPTSGSVTAWYTGLAAPIPTVSSGLGSNGPSAPINCDRVFTANIANSTTTNVLAPLQTGDTIVICGFSVGFGAATTSGNIQFQWAATNVCSGLSLGWYMPTLASTPQILVFPIQQRSPALNLQFPCFVNQSGATATLNLSYASVHGL